MIHVYIKIDIDYVKYLYHKLIVYNCMLSISCKHMILITFNMAKT
jgi:hypothetical protein